jgi:hypothetical protein
MKILSLVLLLMAGLAFVLPGCTDSPSPIEASTDQALSTGTSPSALAKGNGVAGSAIGEGHYFVSLSGANSGNLVAVRVAFTAIKHKNGTCTGQYEMFYLDANNKATLRIKGIVKGIKFYENVAMFYGEVQTAFYVDVYGKQAWRQIFVVTDNGKRKSGVPDRISNPWLTTDGVWPGEFDLFWGYTAEKFLEEMPANIGITEADYPITKGDVRVNVE